MTLLARNRLALAGGMTIQSIRASREADRANLEADTSREVSEFLVHLFEESNPELLQNAWGKKVHDLVKAGKVRYIGASSMYAWQFAKFLYLAPFLFGYVPAFSLDGSAADIGVAFALIVIGTWLYSWLLSGIWVKYFRKSGAAA